MTEESQAVWFNGVPLLALAALYLGVSAAVVPAFLRRCRDATLAQWAHALLLPCVGVGAALLGIQVLIDREPLGGAVWLPLAGVLVAAAPAVLFAARAGDRALVAAGFHRVTAAEERASLRERELSAIEAISAALARAGDAESVARVLLDEIAALFSVEFAAIALVDEQLNEAHGLLGRRDGADFDYWRGLRFDLRQEPSGIASAAFEVAPVTVYDTQNSPLIKKDVAEAVGARSAAFVPLVSGERVIAVLAIATTRERRAFSTEELGPLRTVAAEAALALERARSASALAEALERERLISSIASKVRSELDLDAVLRVTVEEIARALGLARCFVRLGDTVESLSMATEWSAPGFLPIGAEAAERLPASNTAVRRGRTTSIADVADELQGEGRELLLGMGSRSVLATPIVVFDRVIGVLGLHRAEPHTWRDSECALAEAVARELGLGIHTARLLRENALRLAQQSALLNAAQIVTGELRLETVLQLLVDQVTELLHADAADCCLFASGGSMLRCAAVRGLDPGVIGFEFRSDHGLTGRALAESTPVRDQEYGRMLKPVPHSAYEGFAAAMVAPMSWAGETRGVLGVATRERDRVFSDADADALASFATLASLALRNAESFELHERQARVESSFSRIASLLGEPVSLAETLDAVAQAAADAFGGDAAVVLMPGPAGFWLGGEHAASESLRRAFAEGLPAGAQVLDRAAREQKTIVSSALAADDRFGAEFQQATEAASLVAIPIKAPRSERAALALVFFRAQRTFVDDDLDLAGQLAAGAKAALARSEVFEVERRSRLLAQQLARTGSLFSGELEPGAVLDEVVEQARVLLRADASVIRLLEEDALTAVAAVGAGAVEVQGTRVPAQARPHVTVVHSRAGVSYENVAGDDALLDGEPMLGRGYAGYLAVPLFGSEEDELQGVLAIFSRSPRGWQVEEVEALEALAANASVAYAKAELYQQVELERERSVAILANVADGIVAVNREERVVLWNAAAERITGVPPEEAVGRTILEVLQRELRSETGAVPGDRLVPIRRGDTEVWLSLTEAVMRDPAGETAGRIFAFRDISAERVVEQMRSDFVSTVSHELRAPLTSIYGFAATLMREDVEFDEHERRIFLTYIESEAQRLTAIVDKLLNVARLDAGDLQLELAPVDVRSLVSEVVEDARSAVNANGHEFVLDLPDSPLPARTDADKLRQVLANLVDNALRFSPSGGTVTVGATQRGETIVLSVVDQGVGIPSTEHGRIFSKFYRVGDAQTGGTGVGLFIAQGLVSALGGRISVRSSEGRGSSFVVELPAHGADGGGE
ncbi:MAG TPA: GAF domain-containing protein [Gaiellaceae bacterium]|nr:GAF domain-containing protein [Gaiellaceae bacterium]